MSKRFNLNQLAEITGFTTRTLRNYLRQGLLEGEKIDGNWSFTEEELGSFLSDSFVKQALESKRNAIVHDFLADTDKKQNSICLILDCPVSNEEAMENADFFCKMINEKVSDVQFVFRNERHMARYILRGSEDSVLSLVKEFYALTPKIPVPMRTMVEPSSTATS